MEKTINLCLELGINTFDHADIYGGYACEELFGNVIANGCCKKRRPRHLHQMRRARATSGPARCAHHGIAIPPKTISSKVSTIHSKNSGPIT